MDIFEILFFIFFITMLLSKFNYFFDVYMLFFIALVMLIIIVVKVTNFDFLKFNYLIIINYFKKLIYYFYLNLYKTYELLSQLFFLQELRNSFYSIDTFKKDNSFLNTTDFFVSHEESSFNTDLCDIDSITPEFTEEEIELFNRIQNVRTRASIERSIFVDKFLSGEEIIFTDSDNKPMFKSTDKLSDYNDSNSNNYDDINIIDDLIIEEEVDFIDTEDDEIVIYEPEIPYWQQFLGKTFTEEENKVPFTEKDLDDCWDVTKLLPVHKYDGHKFYTTKYMSWYWGTSKESDYDWTSMSFPECYLHEPKKTEYDRVLGVPFELVEYRRSWLDTIKKEGWDSLNIKQKVYLREVYNIGKYSDFWDEYNSKHNPPLTEEESLEHAQKMEWLRIATENYDKFRVTKTETNLHTRHFGLFIHR